MTEQFRDDHEKEFIDFLWSKYNDDIKNLKAFRDSKPTAYGDFELAVEDERGNK